MDWQLSLYLIIPAFFISLLVLPVFVEARVSFNPLYNRGVVALFVFKKKIFYFLISFHGTYIELENEKETKRQELEFESPQFEFMKAFVAELKDKVRLKKLYVFYHIGTGDAFSSALVCGLLNLACTQLFLILKSHKPTASFCVYDTVAYNHVESEVAGRMAFSISFFDVVYSFVHSVIITKRK